MAPVLILMRRAVAIARNAGVFRHGSYGCCSLAALSLLTLSCSAQCGLNNGNVVMTCDSTGITGISWEGAQYLYSGFLLDGVRYSDGAFKRTADYSITGNAGPTYSNINYNAGVYGPREFEWIIALRILTRLK